MLNIAIKRGFAKRNLLCREPWWLSLPDSCGYCVAFMRPSVVDHTFISFKSHSLPFNACVLVFVFQAIWENRFYYMFGFLFLVFLILVIVCSEITIVIIYFMLCGEVGLVEFLISTFSPSQLSCGYSTGCGIF